MVPKKQKRIPLNVNPSPKDVADLVNFVQFELNNSLSKASALSLDGKIESEIHQVLKALFPLHHEFFSEKFFTQMLSEVMSQAGANYKFIKAKVDLSKSKDPYWPSTLIFEEI